MGRTVAGFLREQHRALAVSLRRALTPDGGVDVDAFDEFRHALLWHVSVEERVVMPAIVRALGRAPDDRRSLRKDHAGIVALCVPLPEREWVENLRDLLDEHYRVEEEPGGFLARCDEVLVSSLNDRVLADIDAHPPIKVATFRKGPSVRAQLAHLLKATGLDGR
ncbi:MAG: hemerythrin domain-containing protein [Myxococcaceae bacterium]|nr:hemerythrin domain-containing protein [Myxococcaceae bacterium]